MPVGSYGMDVRLGAVEEYMGPCVNGICMAYCAIWILELCRPE